MEASQLKIEHDLKELQEWMVNQGPNLNPDDIITQIRELSIIKHSILVPKCQGIFKKNGQACCARASKEFDSKYCKRHGRCALRKEDAKRINQGGYVICNHRRSNGAICKTRCPSDERFCYLHRRQLPEQEESEDEEDGLVDTFDATYFQEMERRVRNAIPNAPPLDARPSRCDHHRRCGLCNEALEEEDKTDLCSFCSVRRCDHICCFNEIKEESAPSFKGWKFCSYHAHLTEPKDDSFINIYAHQVGRRTEYIDKPKSERANLWGRIFRYYAYREAEYEKYSEGFRDQITTKAVEVNYDDDRELIPRLDVIFYMWDLRDAIDSSRLSSLFPFEKKDEYIMYYRPQHRHQWSPSSE